MITIINVEDVIKVGLSIDYDLLFAEINKLLLKKDSYLLLDMTGIRSINFSFLDGLYKKHGVTGLTGRVGFVNTSDSNLATIKGIKEMYEKAEHPAKESDKAIDWWDGLSQLDKDYKALYFDKFACRITKTEIDFLYKNQDINKAHNFSAKEQEQKDNDRFVKGKTLDSITKDDAIKILDPYLTWLLNSEWTLLDSTKELGEPSKKFKSNSKRYQFWFMADSIDLQNVENEAFDLEVINYDVKLECYLIAHSLGYYVPKVTEYFNETKKDKVKNESIQDTNEVLQNKDGSVCRISSPSALNAESLPKQIKELRKENKYNQQEVAAHLEISLRKYQYLEYGQHEITMKEFLSLMDLYNKNLLIEPKAKKSVCF